MNPQPSSSSDQPPNYPATHVMGTPIPPSNPYVQYNAPPPPPPPSNNNMDNVRKKLNTWGNKAETTATNIWTNRKSLFLPFLSLINICIFRDLDLILVKTGPSVTGSAWGKMNLTAKALTEGGFESLYKQNFTVYPNEKLNRTFACHLSTSTGPVAGTLYLSNIHVAFCSDRPLSSIQPNGMESMIYYKLIIPLEKVATVNPVTVTGKKQIDKYIQISTIDSQDFWFMGFVNHEKAAKHLLNGVSTAAPPRFP